MNAAQQELNAAKTLLSDGTLWGSGELVNLGTGCYCTLGAIGAVSGISESDLNDMESYDAFESWPSVIALANAISELHPYYADVRSITSRVFMFSDNMFHQGKRNEVMLAFDRAVELAA